MSEVILQFLRNTPVGFVSGEEIARHLKMTRTAVWKKVQHLRAAGYEIEASRRLGYHLVQAPDLLTPEEVLPGLETRTFGRRIHYFPALPSTNTEAYQLALQGGREGEIVIAECQKKGRGRVGRPWFSPAFVNLYLSVILRPPISPHQASLITFVAAVATAEAVERFSGVKPSIKWPNDILVKGRKLAGLLNEIHSEADRIHFVILGIGINLNVDENMFPIKIRPLATSLKREMGRAISRKAFLQILLEELEHWYEIFLRKGSSAILSAWRDRARIAGKQVKISSFDEVFVGRAVDVDSEGALLVQTRDGKQKRIVAGDVEYTK
jgi:BirA family biotin operon repressor/biotin-[acetyl-CoA-carboxylase] ligase